LVKHILDVSLFDVQTSVFFTLDVLVTKFGYESDGIEACVFSEGVWKKLQRFTELSNAVGIGSEYFS
jgi:hypothetical protein